MVLYDLLIWSHIILLYGPIRSAHMVPQDLPIWSHYLATRTHKAGKLDQGTGKLSSAGRGKKIKLYNSTQLNIAKLLFHFLILFVFALCQWCGMNECFKVIKVIHRCRTSVLTFCLIFNSLPFVVKASLRPVVFLLFLCCMLIWSSIDISIHG